MSEWKPLSDMWDDYNESIQRSMNDGTFDSYDTAQDIIWPVPLHLADSEKENINEFLIERTNEVLEHAKTKGLTPKIVASFLFKSLITGMSWEKNRIGN